MQRRILITLFFWGAHFGICQLGGFLDYRFNNDEPSYRLLPLDSFAGALSSHRTIGLPLFIKLFESLSLPGSAWPLFQWSLVSVALLSLFILLCRAGFSKVLSLLVVTMLALNPHLLSNLPYAQSEALSLAALFITFGFFLCWLFRPHRGDGLGFGLFLFLTYQIRPALGFVALLFVFIAIFAKRQRIGIVSASFLPLFLFCLMRFVFVGDFGIVSYSGTNLVGHALMELNAETLRQLPPPHQPLGQMLLARKNTALSYCTEDDSHSFSQRIGLRFPCHNFLQMTAWQLLIEQRHHRAPFRDERLNIEPWKHTQTLSGYFSVPNVEMDHTLGEFSRALIRMRPLSYVRWVGAAFLYSLKETLKSIPLIFGVFSGLMLILFRPQAKSASFALFALGFWLFGNLTTVMFSVPNSRYYHQFSVFLMPLLALGLAQVRRPLFAWVPRRWRRDRHSSSRNCDLHESV